jgi:catechol 2,3-dioxygenase-like lactoylglutathione lyase family enzyme
MTSNLKAGHIGLNVRNLERSREFYGTVFGFETVFESSAPGRKFAFLGLEDRPILTLWQQSEEEFQKKSAGLHHLSFEAESIDQVKRAEEKLRTLGVKFQYEGIVPHREGAASGGIFFEDPDGIRLEIFSPTGLENKKAPHADAPSCGFF